MAGLYGIMYLSGEHPVDTTWTKQNSSDLYNVCMLGDSIGLLLGRGQPRSPLVSLLLVAGMS